MLSWASILYGAALSAAAAGAVLGALARPRQPAVILAGVLATAAGPLAGMRSCAPPTPASSSPTPPCACCRPAGKTPARACSPWPPLPCCSGSGRWPPPRGGARSGWPCSAAWPRSWSTSTCTDQPVVEGWPRLPVPPSQVMPARPNDPGPGTGCLRTAEQGTRLNAPAGEDASLDLADALRSGHPPPTISSPNRRPKR